MDFTEYQELSLGTMHKNGETRKEMLARLALGVAEESGEVCGKIKKYIRGDKGFFETRELVAKEIGDVLWYLSVLCSNEFGFGLDLEIIAIENIKKLQDRKKRGVIKGSGDSR